MSLEQKVAKLNKKCDKAKTTKEKIEIQNQITELLTSGINKIINNKLKRR